MSGTDRRRFLRAGVASLAAAGVAPPRSARAGQSDAMARISAYISAAAATELPRTVAAAARRHILDSLTAMVSGSRLLPGRLAARYAQAQRGIAEAQVAGTKLLASAVNAAFANGMMAHADETDDSHRATLVHPGAAIVPAALALAEKLGADGTTFLRSVVAGYDVGCRTVLALGPERLLQGSGATPGIGGCIGAAAACGAVTALPQHLVPTALAYAAQQASGVNSWVRDQEHVEKAFVFGGMPARNGVMAAELVQNGFTGEEDPFSGPDNFLSAFSSRPDLARLTEGLGREYEILLTDMKRFPVGFPIQAATDAVLKLIAEGVQPADISRLTVRLPTPGVNTVNDRNMPNVNVQYIVAATLIDRRLAFETAHSLERMKDPQVIDLKQRISLVEDAELSAQKRTREANIEVTRTDGRSFTVHGVARGTIENPMTDDELEGKARELMSPVLGQGRTERLILAVRDLEALKNMRALRPLLTA